MIPSKHFRWTAANYETLRRMWPTHSASEIASILHCTRNAVIGKADRMGLNTECPKEFVPGPKPSMHPAAVKTRRLRAERAAAAGGAPRSKPAPVALPAPIVSKMVTLEELRHRHCRWPMGEPTSEEFRYCGADRESPTVPYCSGHARLAYKPTPGLILKLRGIR